VADLPSGLWLICRALCGHLADSVDSPGRAVGRDVLAAFAARRVFLARGYHGATLEQIADEAGFSKGVVYSQFQGKADLFLALLEARIEERARENARLAEEMAEGGDLRGLLEHLVRADNAMPGWLLLVIELAADGPRPERAGRVDARLRQRHVPGGAGRGGLPAVARFIGDYQFS
jgi:AcrR family transcriptional regulator